jgi:hypothetical protein
MPVTRSAMALLFMVAACGKSKAPAGDPAAEAEGAGPIERAPAASAGASTGTLGTLTANVNGTPHTWYIVAGETASGTQASAGWFPRSRGGRAIAISGFDIDDPPLTTFEWNAEGQLTGYGSYTGSVLSLMVMVADNPGPTTITFPDDRGSGAAAIYMPQASGIDLSQLHLLSEGSLALSSIAFSGDEARLDGTFSGTFKAMSSGDTIRITDGQFHVAGLGRLRSGDN